MLRTFHQILVIVKEYYQSKHLVSSKLQYDPSNNQAGPAPMAIGAAWKGKGKKRFKGGKGLKGKGKRKSKEKGMMKGYGKGFGMMKGKGKAFPKGKGTRKRKGLKGKGHNSKRMETARTMDALFGESKTIGPTIVRERIHKEPSDRLKKE